ncbi:MAG: hypothetical protein Q9228_000657 [Teloschistes exilis]
MASENVALPELTNIFQQSVMPACDTTMGVLASSVAAAFNVHLGFQFGRTTPPSLAGSPSSSIGISSSQPVSILAVDPVFVNPHQTEIVKVEGEPFDDVSSFDLVLTPERTCSPNRTVNFSTNVDSLMRTIQRQSKRPSRHRLSPLISDTTSLRSSPESDAMQSEHSLLDPKRRKPQQAYQCSEMSCAKVFHQRTHLEIHERAHTGQKPFFCKEPTCGRRFSQLGNLKTHERRHTGEKPYSCEECGKRFSQRGNVRAHRIVHQGIKPYDCRLEQCGKRFTQLGNLKSHQNRFHAVTLQELNEKFASMREGDTVSATDKDLWEYFAALYKHSNKGIKGRGKDRRISVVGEGDPTRKRGPQSERGPNNGGLYSGVASGANMAAEHRGREVRMEDIVDVCGDFDEMRQSTPPPGFECSMELYEPPDEYV